MYEKEIVAMIETALKAEKVINEVYETPFEVEIKKDDSPVTKADKMADKLIRDELSKLFPDYGFLTEESTDDGSRLNKKMIFVVDPVDGTKEFVSRNGEFTTNIALVEDHEVVAGVINAPQRNYLYYATKHGGAYRLDKATMKAKKIHVNDKVENLLVVKSISFLNEKEVELINKHSDRIKEQKSVGAALKFCAIAEGSAELQYRIGGFTKEWDVAAGDIILTEAGGFMLKPDGTRYKYNRKDVYNHEGYLLVNKMDNFLL